MYKHIFVATDGSALSVRAVEEAVKLAHACGARLSGFHCAPNYTSPYPGEASMGGLAALDQSALREDFEQRTKVAADHALAIVDRIAGETGVAVDTVFERSDSPSLAILAAVARLDCDCIVMASHGRRGIIGMLLGSETHKVLTHCKVPTLVVR